MRIKRLNESFDPEYIQIGGRQRLNLELLLINIK